MSTKLLQDNETNSVALVWPDMKNVEKYKNDLKDFYSDFINLLLQFNIKVFLVINDKDDKQTTRVIIFFQNFSPVEVVFNKRKDPSKNQLNSGNKYPWNLVISTFVNSKALMQVDINLIGAKKITLDINIPNYSLYRLAINSKSLLENKFIKNDIDIGAISIKNEKVEENNRSELLSPSGNMNFVV